MSNDTFTAVTNLFDAIAPDNTLVARYELAGGFLEVHDAGNSVVTWFFNGGAGGAHTGVWNSVADAQEWLEANGDAIDDEETA